MDLAGLLVDQKFQFFLFKIDKSVAIKAKGRGCPHCRGPLNWANYSRKPRLAGHAQIDASSIRFSLCCAADSCRRRLTPPSVRFFGRRVYAASAVALVTAAREGFVGDRFESLRRALGVTTNAVRAWRKWWSEVVPAAGTSWSWAVGRLFPVVDMSMTPLVGLAKLMASYGTVRGLSVFLLACAPIGTRDLTTVHLI